MTPINFDDCFGWLHSPTPDIPAQPFGVVICGAIGFEKQVLHRPMRVLAQRLAAAGVAVLRFDYPGTGDSAGLDTDPGLVASWLQSIDDAASQLQILTGVTEIVLVGVHLGASLAAAAGSRRQDRRMVLLAPVLSGRRFLRTLRLIASVTLDAAPPSQAGGFAVEAAGLRLTEEAAAELDQIDLGRLPQSPAQHILLLDATAADTQSVLATKLRHGGATVDHAAFPGLDRLMVDADRSQVPDAAWSKVIDWLLASAAQPAEATPSARRNAPAGDWAPADWAPWYPTPQATERPLQFGAPGREMVGILCEPAATRASTGVVLCNTGGNPHYGPGRLSVHLARLLATNGIASLRIDLPGIGDAPLPDEASLPHMYVVDRGQDLRLALDQLEALGHTRLAIFGVCSGAFHALRMALADPRVRDVVLVNQLIFDWGENRLIALLRSGARLVSHRRLEPDEENSGSEELLQAQLSHTRKGWQRVRRAGFHLAEIGRRLGLPVANDPRRRFSSLALRGVRTLIAVGRQDASLTLLEGHFGSEGHVLTALPGTTLLIDPAFDHSMASQAARERIGPALVGFLTSAPAQPA